jgi:leucine dehydrogenase
MPVVNESKEVISGEKGIFGQVTGYGHEQVVFCHDKETGLKSIIAVHDTTLGPALGGTRFWNYKSEEEAIRDVLRLSRGMTYKNAVCGIHLGGGKAVIIGDVAKLGNEAFWRRYGQFVDSLGGKYITAEDVGTSTRDMEYIALETKHVAGLPEYLGGGGDPSPYTAYGVYLGMQASAKEVWGNESLAGKKVLVEGIGHVGGYLVDHLVKDGAQVFITDIRQERLKEIAANYKVTVVDGATAYDLDIDVYSPCALGATLNTVNIERLKCAVVAGAANNQLEDEKVHGEMLREKGIAYAPDFLINAGGVINCYAEVTGNYNRERAMAGTEKIYGRTLDIFKRAESEDITTHAAALKLAEERIRSIAKINSKW